MALPAPATYPYVSALDPLPWMDEAVCAQTDPDVFFPGWGDATAVRHSKAVCRVCPVRAECLKFGLRDEYGTWGGLTANERRALRQERRMS